MLLQAGSAGAQDTSGGVVRTGCRVRWYEAGGVSVT